MDFARSYAGQINGADFMIDTPIRYGL